MVWFSSLLLVLFCSALAVNAWVGTSNGQRVRHQPRSNPRLLSPTLLFAEESNSKRKVVIVGGGWAGLSAADALAPCDGVEVTILDASPQGPGGLAGGWRTPLLQQPVEAGLHGFWREYRNAFRVMESIPGVELDEVLTPYTPSLLVSSSGRVALAPVLKKETKTASLTAETLNLTDDLLRDPSSVVRQLADLLPPPLDVALLSEFSPTSPLTTVDRLSAVGLLGAWADFGQEDAASWERYDEISADNLFRYKAGVTDTLYQELVAPLLHVLPMTTGYDCSAAAALSCFHVFALQSQGAFDVRWCRGSIAERIFDPWTRHLQEQGVEICKGARVTSITKSDKDNTYQVKVDSLDSTTTTLDCDAVIMAVGGTAMKRLASTCPPLAALPQARYWESSLRGVTCVAVRLFLKSPSGQLPAAVAAAMSDSPVCVCGPNIGNIPELVETGFCIYDLQRLQDDFAIAEQAVLEVDFFRADDIANIADDAKVADLALRAVTAALEIPHPIVQDPSDILEVSVLRARNAVSHFCVNSAKSSPPVQSQQQGMYFCGDWIDRTGHASWSTEKAVVTGRQAAEALSRDFSLTTDCSVLPAAPDTPQLSALRGVAKTLRQISPFAGIPSSPWATKQGLGAGGGIP